MKFQDYKYERPVVEEIKKDADVLFSAMENAATKEEFLEHMDAFIQLRLHVETMLSWYLSATALIPEMSSMIKSPTMWIWKCLSCRIL